MGDIIYREARIEESEKIGKIFIDKRPNGVILIETTETKKYQNRVCKKATWFQKFQITIE